MYGVYKAPEIRQALKEFTREEIELLFGLIHCLYSKELLSKTDGNQPSAIVGITPSEAGMTTEECDESFRLSSRLAEILDRNALQSN